MSTVFKKFTDAGFKLLGKHLTKNNKIGRVAMALTLSTLAACAPLPQDGGYAPINQQAVQNYGPRFEDFNASTGKGTFVTEFKVGRDQYVPVKLGIFRNDRGEFQITYPWVTEPDPVRRGQLETVLTAIRTNGSYEKHLIDQQIAQAYNDWRADSLHPLPQSTSQVNGNTLHLTNNFDGDSVTLTLTMNGQQTLLDMKSTLRDPALPREGIDIQIPSLQPFANGPVLTGKETAALNGAKEYKALAEKGIQATPEQVLRFAEAKAYYTLALACYTVNPNAPILDRYGNIMLTIETSAGDISGRVHRGSAPLIRMEASAFAPFVGRSNEDTLYAMRQGLIVTAKGLGSIFDHRATGGVKLRSNYTPSSSNPYNRGYTP